jgi:ABC-type uncharacterized transport system involved in gliding motility auxiliary subunit
MLPATPTQFPLMVHLTGAFPSFFADKPIPEAPSDKTDTPAVEDWGRDPAVEDPEGKDPAVKDPEGKDPEGKDAKKPPTEEEKKKKKGTEGQGPPAAKPAVPEAVQTESKLDRAEATASLLVIGDATFIRDDFISLRYQKTSQEHAVPVGGPLDKQGPRAELFCKNLLDWLCQEHDLLALQNKRPTERTMKLAVQNQAQQETQEEFGLRVRNRQSLIRGLNMYGPALFLFLLGMVVLFQRRRQKRIFLSGQT